MHSTFDVPANVHSGLNPETRPLRLFFAAGHGDLMQVCGAQRSRGSRQAASRSRVSRQQVMREAAFSPGGTMAPTTPRCFTQRQARRGLPAVSPQARRGLRSATSKGRARCCGAAMRYFFFFTLVTGPRRSLSLKLTDARVHEP